MTRAELLAQAEALEWAFNTWIIGQGEQRSFNEKIAELRAQAAEMKVDEPVAYWNASYSNPCFSLKPNAPGIGVNGTKLYTRPDPRVKELEELLREVAGEHQKVHIDLHNRIRAALKEKP